MAVLVVTASVLVRRITAPATDAHGYKHEGTVTDLGPYPGAVLDLPARDVPGLTNTSISDSLVLLDPSAWPIVASDRLVDVTTGLVYEVQSAVLVPDPEPVHGLNISCVRVRALREAFSVIA